MNGSIPISCETLTRILCSLFALTYHLRITYTHFLACFRELEDSNSGDVYNVKGCESIKNLELRTCHDLPRTPTQPQIPCPVSWTRHVENVPRPRQRQAISPSKGIGQTNPIQPRSHKLKWSREQGLKSTSLGRKTKTAKALCYKLKAVKV